MCHTASGGLGRPRVGHRPLGSVELCGLVLSRLCSACACASGTRTGAPRRCAAARRAVRGVLGSGIDPPDLWSSVGSVFRASAPRVRAAGPCGGTMGAGGRATTCSSSMGPGAWRRGGEAGVVLGPPRDAPPAACARGVRAGIKPCACGSDAGTRRRRSSRARYSFACLSRSRKSRVYEKTLTLTFGSAARTAKGRNGNGQWRRSAAALSSAPCRKPVGAPTSPVGAPPSLDVRLPAHHIVELGAPQSRTSGTPQRRRWRGGNKRCNKQAARRHATAAPKHARRRKGFLRKQPRCRGNQE